MQNSGRHQYEFCMACHEYVIHQRKKLHNFDDFAFFVVLWKKLFRHILDIYLLTL